ncbi:bud site selection protein 31 [Nematocida minor]|uniref:bud site selection protein 31 n=1 Tax=Nematocida minor TaxID=1912983 RepID=UPI00221E401B|nr:bud site selection protein 31 [Nematocida minor]KAI5189205.1 bud site selection protein 31 [Nematocida minor]
MNNFQKALKIAVYSSKGEKREHRQAEVLKITRERTGYVYNLFLSNRITRKEMGEHIRKGEADFSLIQHWRKEKTKERLCCLLCIRKGKRCVCRKVKGIECSNCLCRGECMG